MAYLLPFFLMFAIVYGAIDFSDIFKNKKVVLIISIVFGFFAISVDAVRIVILSYMPYAALIFVAFFFIGFIKKLFKGKDGQKEVDYFLLAIIAFLIFLFMLTNPNVFSFLPFISGDSMMIAGLILIAFFFYAAYKKKSSK
ncbi:MAG: hypothetical protein ABIF08_04715 [Nanoarchaeota archaeon]